MSPASSIESYYLVNWSFGDLVIEVQARRTESPMTITTSRSPNHQILDFLLLVSHLCGLMASSTSEDALRRQFYGARDIRGLYPRITDNHLRYLEKWGLIRPAANTSSERFYSFADLTTIKQLAS